MRSAVYAGTFDPVTNGHISIIKSVAKLFDRLFVVVAINPEKEPLFSLEERLSMLKDALGEIENIECIKTEDYVVQLAGRIGAKYLVRGVRSAEDAEKEFELANLNRLFAPDIETILIPAKPETSDISSSRLKELARAGRDITEYCPKLVAEKLKELLG